MPCGQLPLQRAADAVNDRGPLCAECLRMVRAAVAVRALQASGDVRWPAPDARPAAAAARPHDLACQQAAPAAEAGAVSKP